MTWIEAVGGIWLNAIGWLIGLGLLFLVLTRFCPCNPGRNWWTDRRAALTDLVYWLMLPLFTQFGRVAFLVAGALILYGGEPPAEFTARRLPVWAQCLAILLVQDALMYGIHRLFHTRAGWRFHAIHHSPEVLDWTSTQRFHPVNAIAEFALADAVVLLMGFSPTALAILGPINLVYSGMVHANLNWTFGPLKYVLASPVFHRWHHTSEEAGLDRNFAPTFPFFDLMFGTFYMPAGKRPEIYGAGEMPAGFAGQMAHPFQNVPGWISRKPLLASGLAVAGIFLGVYGWHTLSKPVEAANLTEAPTPSQEVEAPPALLKFTQADEKREATSVAVRADGSRALFGASDGQLTLRDRAAARDLRPESHARRANCVAFSPDGTLAISASGDGTSRLYETSLGKTLRTLPNHGCTVMSAAVGDDGWAVTGAVDGTVRVWNPRGEVAKKRALGPGSIHAVALSEGGRRAVAAQATGVAIWDVETDKLTPCAGVKSLAYCVAISADGQRVVAGDYDGRVLVWKSEATPLAFGGHAGPIYAIAIDREGRSVATGGADQAVRVWNATDGKLLKEFLGHPGVIFAVALDPARNALSAAGKDGAVSSWPLREEGIVPVGAAERLRGP